MKRIFPLLVILFLASEHAFTQCNMSADITSTLPATCPGTASGSVFISVSNAASPVQYFANGTGTPFSNGGIANFFPAGSHFVSIVDANGCRDSVFFSITEPPAITTQTSTVDAKCNGSNDGSATATAAGGNGAPFIYEWQSCTGGTVQTGSTASNLFAGCYNVTISDSKQCEATAQVTIGQPAAFVFQTSQDSVNCFGGSDGSATINVSGAMPPYTYKWANGSLTPTATGLNANFHAVTVTDVTGCQRTTFVQVLQPSRVNIDSVPVKEVLCFNGNTGSATVFTKGGTKPYTYSWFGGQTTQTASNLNGGEIYTVTVTDWHGCTDVGTAVVPEPPAIQLVMNNIAAETCFGKCDGTAKLNIAGGKPPYSANWGNPNVPIGSTQPTNLCPGTYVVTVTDASGCTNTTSTTISPAAAIVLQTVEKDPRCFTTTDGNIDLSVSGGGSPYTYLWSNGATSQDINQLACGNFTVTVTDFKSCTSTTSVKLDCPPALAIVNFLTDPVKCFGGNTGSATVSPTGGTPPLTYIWNDPNNQTGATASNLTAKNYVVLVTDANGCTSSGTTTVPQPTAVSATIAPTNVKCFGESTGSATATPAGGVSPYQFAWTGGKTGQTIQNLPAGNYSLTVTDGNGCTFTQAQTTINQPATAVQVTAIQQDTSCFGTAAGTARANALGGNGSPYTFKWSNQQATQIASQLAAGNYSVTATDPQGCTATAAVSISNYQEITANIATVAPSCAGQSDGTATVNMVSGGAGNANPNLYQYKWSLPSAPSAPSITNLAGGQNYSLTISDSKGCTATFQTFINLQEPMQVQLQTSPVSCFGLSDGSATITATTNGIPATSYTWSNGATGNEITGITAGTYFVVATNAKGCTEEVPVEITQPDKLEISQFNTDELDCTGDSIAFAEAIVIGGNPSYEFRWDDGTTTAKNANLKAGTYSLVVTDKSGCTVTAEVTIAQPAQLDVSTQTFDIECAGQKNGRVQLKVANGKSPYQYSLGGQKFQTSSSFFNLAAGEFIFVVKDANGCISTASAKINEPLPISLTLPPDTTLLLGDSLQIFPVVENAAGEVDYNWQPTYVEKYQCIDTFDCSAIQVKPNISNIFTLKIVDENGCSAKASIDVKISKIRGAYVPTAFTPNGDFSNDVLSVFGKSRMTQEVTVFRVYDRWGELVFEDKNFKINDITRGWDGTFKDKECQTGEYSWFVEVVYLDGYREIVRGSTLLMR